MQHGLVTNKASDIEEIEKAAKLGLGLKKPLFETAKEFGISNIVKELNELGPENMDSFTSQILCLFLCSNLF